jgi:hypothetical protein
MYSAKKLIFIAVLLIPLSTYAQSGANDLPTSCKSAYMEQVEKANIPNIIGITNNNPSIAIIIPYSSPGYYEYAPGQYRIDCFITVQWSDGTTDSMYEFSAWQSRYNQVMVSYGPIDGN